MKTRKLSFAIIVMAIGAIAVAVVSCKKEKHEQTTNKMEQSAQSSENTDEYLISFKEKLLSAQKGDESITIEQAQLDLGNLLNFDFGDAKYASNVYEYDTLYIALETNGEVLTSYNWPKPTMKLLLQLSKLTEKLTYQRKVYIVLFAIL